MQMFDCECVWLLVYVTCDVGWGLVQGVPQLPQINWNSYSSPVTIMRTSAIEMHGWITVIQGKIK